MLLAVVKLQPLPRRFGVVRRGCYVTCALALSLTANFTHGAPASSLRPVSPAGSLIAGNVAQYCFECHDHDLKKGGLDLEDLSSQEISQHPDAWERVVRKLRA